MKAFFYFFAIMVPVTSLLAEPPAFESQRKPVARVAFEQYCFWTGEMKLGQIEGVIRTEAGFFQGHEVTLVDYDSGRISLEQLARQAKRAGVAERVHLVAGSQFSGTSIGGVSLGGLLDGSYRTAPASDQKKQMQGTRFAGLELTPEEATKVNAFVRSDPQQAFDSLGATQRAKLAATR